MKDNVLGRSAWAAISIMRAALLEELEELKRTAGVTRLAAKAAVIGARVAMRANMVGLIGVLFWWFGVEERVFIYIYKRGPRMTSRSERVSS